ncbi:MAG: AIR carboxylase family protein, partial [Deltaproteobacteria bacterium]
VQMPAGVPVATMGIGKAGAKNAALFAIRILSLQNTTLQKKLTTFITKMTKEVETKHKQAIG